ncbi:MAG: cell division protein SepF [Lachnospiraceae bacterium]
MSLLNKLMELTRLTEEDDDDYFYDDEEEFDDDRPPRRTAFSRDKDDEEEEAPKPRFMGSARSSSGNKVVPMRSRGMEVTMVRPTSMEDSKEICDYLLSGKAVLLNMEGIHTEIAQRIIDFTSGSTYSMRGNLKKISNYIFIVTPESVELSGDFQEFLSGNTIGGTGGLNIHL